MRGIVMNPKMEVTVKNIELLSPSSFAKASEYIESLLRSDAKASSQTEVNNRVFAKHAEALFDEYSETFSVLAK